MIGSPKGLAAGYFLLQHKRQLGIKNIWNVVVFRNDGQSSRDINLMFYGDPNPSPEEEVPEVPEGPGDNKDNHATAAQHNIQSSVVKRSADGMSFVRERVFQAKY